MRNITGVVVQGQFETHVKVQEDESNKKSGGEVDRESNCESTWLHLSRMPKAGNPSKFANSLKRAG